MCLAGLAVIDAPWGVCAGCVFFPSASTGIGEDCGGSCARTGEEGVTNDNDGMPASTGRRKATMCSLPTMMVEKLA